MPGFVTAETVSAPELRHHSGQRSSVGVRSAWLGIEPAPIGTSKGAEQRRTAMPLSNARLLSIGLAAAAIGASAGLTLLRILPADAPVAAASVAPVPSGEEHRSPPPTSVALREPPAVRDPIAARAPEPTPERSTQDTSTARRRDEPAAHPQPPAAKREARKDAPSARAKSGERFSRYDIDEETVAAVIAKRRPPASIGGIHFYW
jgi:hypothetical protein